MRGLEDVKELAASDNVDTFVISYNSLLQVRALEAAVTSRFSAAKNGVVGSKELCLLCQVAPGIHPLLVERVIVARPDLLRADIREVSTPQLTA